MIKLYHALSPRSSTPFECEGESCTEQCHKDESDINVLIDRYSRTGYLGDPSQYSKSQPMFGDYSDVPVDYGECVSIIREGSALFADLPSSLRAEFQNDPAKFFSFVSDPSNHKRCVSLGLLPDFSDDSPESDDNRTSQEAPPPPASTNIPPLKDPPFEPPYESSSKTSKKV